MRSRLPIVVLAIAGAGPSPADERPPSRPDRPAYRTLNDRFGVPRYSSLPQWQERAEYLRQHILASAGLLPPPEKTPLRAQVFDEQKHDDYSREGAASRAGPPLPPGRA